MTGLEKILERIEGEARERASAILQRSEEECAELAREYATRAEQMRERLEKEGLEAIEATVNAARAQSEKTHTEILQSTRRALLDEAFERAKKELCSNDRGKYRELLAALLVSALLEQHRAEQQSIAFGDEVAEFDCFEVLFNAEDRERFGAQVLEDARRTVERRIGVQKAAKLTLSDRSVEIDGGLVLRFGDVELNCALGILMADIRRDLEARVAEILFGKNV